MRRVLHLLAIAVLSSLVSPLVADEPKAEVKPDVVSYKDVDLQPGITDVVYPWTRDGWHGKVLRGVFALTVSSRGMVKEVVILEANDAKFGEVMRRLILRWRFSAAQLGGKSVACATVLTLEFEVAKEALPRTDNYHPVRRALMMAGNGKPGSDPKIEIRTFGAER